MNGTEGIFNLCQHNLTFIFSLFSWGAQRFYVFLFLATHASPMAKHKLHDDTHLDGFAVGIIAALRDEGHTVRDIAANPLLAKPSGHFHTVSADVRRLGSEPMWRGDRSVPFSQCRLAGGQGKPRLARLVDI